MSDASQPLPGLQAFCQAVRSGNPDEIESRRGEFVSRNWTLVTALDQMAGADFAAGKFAAAHAKLVTLEQLAPGNALIFIRRVAAGIRTGAPGGLDELAASAPRIADDQELLAAIDELLFNGRADLASNLVDACAGRAGFSTGLIAAARSRILAAQGWLSEALAIVAPDADSDAPNLTAMRSHYLLLTQLLEFQSALLFGVRAALQWGEERDLRYVFDHLLHVFEFDQISLLFREYLRRYAGRADLIDQLKAQTARVKTSADAAIAEHGAASGDDPAAIFTALSDAKASPTRVMWGKLSLIALLRGNALTEEDYARFAWYVPNWESPLTRQLVLFAARQNCPDAPMVRRGWLHHLVTNAAYADAARECGDLLAGSVDEDTLFFAVMLLRLEQDAVVPSFIEPDLFERLRKAVLERAPETDAGFRSVMHDHFVALGAPPLSWPLDAMPVHDDPEGRGFRRLFAVTTGRLGRVSAKSIPRGFTKPRPVLAISGQLRGFETVWPSIHGRLGRPSGAPVIMSVWDKSLNAKGRHGRRLERTLPEDIVARLSPEERYTDIFEATYPETAKLLFEQSDVAVDSLRALIEQRDCELLTVETESETLLEQILHPHFSPNMLKMYYKLARLEALIREAETASGEIFSHVIWTRPDASIERLSADDLASCLARTDVAWSSFVTYANFGHHAMILPRHAFATIATIFPRICLAGDGRLLPWRPNREVRPSTPATLETFGGPDLLFAILLAAGYMPVSPIPRIRVNLVGRTPGTTIVRDTFNAERGRSMQQNELMS